MFGQKKNKKAKPPVYNIGDIVLDYRSRACEVVSASPCHDDYIYHVKYDGGDGFYKAEHLTVPTPKLEEPITTSEEPDKAAELIDG